MSDNIDNTPTISYIDNGSREDRVAYLKKMNKMRKKALTLNWEKDKMMSASMMGYKYLSSDKIKQNLAPLFADFGLEIWQLRFHDAINHGECGKLTSRWTVMLDMQLADIDTGFVGPIDTTYGEAGDTLDKGLGKAQTYAIKEYLTAKFQVVDGIDPDEDPMEDAPRGFQPKTEAEKKVVLAEVKSKALEAKEAPKAEPVKEDPKAEVAEAPKKAGRPKKAAEPAPVAPAEEKPAEPVAEAPKEESKVSALVEVPNDDPIALGDFKLTAIQDKTLRRKFGEWSQAYKDGKIKESTYDDFVTKYKNLKSSSEVIKLSTAKIVDPAE